MNIVGTDRTVSRLEMPHLNSKYDYICHILENGDVNYSLEYDKSMLHSRWVAYAYDSRSAQQNFASRTDAWRGEPYYDNNKDFQLSKNTFGSGYARGHICGSAERYYSREANEQTFYMSNMSPMLNDFNGTHYGEGLETLVRSWGRSVTDTRSTNYGGTLYVVKGGTLDQINGYINVTTTNGTPARMPVPRYYFVACLFVSKQGAARAIGFWMEHKNYTNKTPLALARESACSIDELERLTGFDFFCNLQDNVENLLEKSYDISQWKGL